MTGSNREIFSPQIIANLSQNVTERPKDLETSKIWSFSGKNFVAKFLKIAKGGIFALECISNKNVSYVF